MATVVVSVPENTINVNDGEKIVKKNLLLTFMGQLIESYPQKNDTDAYLIHSIRERIDSHNGQDVIQMEESEIELLNQSIKNLRDRQALVGSGWYFVIKALGGAIPIKTYERQKQKK